MEREANYAAVGAFVLLVLLMAGLFVYWYSDASDRRSYTRYEIYFYGSVSGLPRGGAVRYLGVDVGRVVDMRIDPRDSSRVQVIVDIDSTAPISSRTVAKLSLQGVTGVLFIDLIQDKKRGSLNPPVPSLKYPVIASSPSNLDIFLASLPDLVRLATNVVERVALVLSDKNIATLTSTLENVDRASSSLPGTMKELQSLLVDLRNTTQEIRTAATSIRNVTDGAGPELTAAMGRVNDVADNLARATERLDLIISDNRQDLRAFTREGLPELENLLREGRAAAREVRNLSRSLRENPSQILYQPPEQGVEIPR